MPLAALVPSFELDCEEKPFFPHLVNREDNYGLDILPTTDDYLADGMLPKKRKKFMDWYEQHKYETFRLEEAVSHGIYPLITILLL